LNTRCNIDHLWYSISE